MMNGLVTCGCFVQARASCGALSGLMAVNFVYPFDVVPPTTILDVSGSRDSLIRESRTAYQRVATPLEARREARFRG